MSSWQSKIRKVEPYVPGEQPDISGMIKLNTNENPYPPSPKVEQVIREFQADRLRLYPDPGMELLRKSLSDSYLIPEDMIFTGVGSDDVLATAFMTFFHSKEPVIFADITYSFYDVWARLFRIPYKTIAVDENFRLRREDYYHDNGGIIIANPNAPTGIYEDNSLIEDILRHNRNSVVIVDEAYIDFAGASAIELIKDYDNLLVVRTFSKSFSLAGVRIGYCMGSREMIKAMNDIKYSFNSYTLNTISMEIGKAALEDKEYFKSNIAKITDTREYTKKRLTELGFVFPDSRTNFIFAKHKNIAGKELFLHLRKHNIFVRHFDKERISDYLRITVGTQEEMDCMLKCLEQYLNERVF